ncbi:hypothetical protein CZ774_06620 [Frigoribacterium sp. JB110]|nr:hypothetical protein CZ774_06620 [Frigoribacterium sp. JB110]
MTWLIGRNPQRRIAQTTFRAADVPTSGCSATRRHRHRIGRADTAGRRRLL